MTGSRGRPRDPRRDEAILAAARVEFADRGYTGASMHEIARRAGVGKDTLYRRWASKADLAVDLIERLARDAVRPVPLEHDARFNLFTYLKDIVRLNRRTDFGTLVAGVVGESARNPELAVPFAEFWARRRELATPLVVDVLGPLATDTEVESVLDQLFGPIYYRLLLTHAPLTDEYLWNLVTRIAWPVDALDDDPAQAPGSTSPTPPTTAPVGAVTQHEG